MAIPLETESLSNFVLGSFVSKLLFGINFVQFLEYHQHFSEDRACWKMIVWSCMIFGTISTAFAAITSFEGGTGVSEDWLNNSPWSFSCIAALTSLVSVQVQIFYAYRVFSTSKADDFLLLYIMPGLICLLAMISFGFGAATSGITFYYRDYAKFVLFTYGIEIWLATAIAADMLISFSIIYNLSIRRETGFVSKSSGVINAIIKHTITNNLATGIVALAEMILFLCLPSHSYYIITLDALSKLYISSLLSSLLSRRTLRKIVANATTVETDFGRSSCPSTTSPWERVK